MIIKKNNWILVVTAMYFGLKPNLFLVVFCFTCKAGPIFFFYLSYCTAKHSFFSFFKKLLIAEITSCRMSNWGRQ